METILPAKQSPQQLTGTGNRDPRLLGVLHAACGSVQIKAVRPEAKVLADHVQADGLIFLNVFAYKSTEGRKTKAAAMNVFNTRPPARDSHPARSNPDFVLDLRPAIDQQKSSPHRTPSPAGGTRCGLSR